MPICLTASRNLKKILALAIIEDEHLYLNYWEKNLGKAKKKLSEVCSEMEAAMSLEISNDDQFAFVGGCDTMNIFEGRPVITAVRMKSSLMEVSSKKLSEVSMKNIFCLRRYKKTNMLVAGGFNSLTLLEFKENNQFVELKQLKNLHNGEIFDLCFFERFIYSVSSKDSYIHKF